MRKTVVILISAFTLLSIMACSGKEVQNNIKSVSLYKKGLNMTIKMDMLAEYEDYSKLFTSGQDIGKLVSDIGSRDYSKPKAVYEITGLEETGFQLLLSEIDIIVDEKVQEHVKEKFGAAVASQINGMNGAEAIAAASILTVEDSFIYRGLDRQKTYLYLYGGEYGSVVTFFPYEDNVVGASASIVMQESLEKIETVDDVGSFFKDTIGFSGLIVTEIME